jgi:hypothetical protein
MAHQLCTNCPLNIDAAVKRVTVHTKAWAGSPTVWLSGYWSDLTLMVQHGLAERRPDGWCVPTGKVVPQ